MSTCQGKPFFPVFLDLSQKKAVVIGGGAIAERRILTLSGFVGSITVVAPEVTDVIQRLAAETGRAESSSASSGAPANTHTPVSEPRENTPALSAAVTWVEKTYERSDIMDADLVLACTNDPNLNNDIYVACKCLGILVNDCSDRNKCDFYFPSVVQKDGVVIGINGGGAAHHHVKVIRQKVEEALGCDASLYSDDKKRKIIIGSRESTLAVVQSNLVIKYLNETHPELVTELLTMKTTGDKILDRRLDQIGGKGLFVKELDKALLEHRSDYSVHSLKDLPMEVPEELPVVAFSKREDPRDVLVLPKGRTEPDLTKPIGTSSLRRILQLAKLFPTATFESVRGNLQTRLRKLDEGQYGAIVLAAAGMKRLGMQDRISRYFSVDEVIPSAGQAILAVQGRRGEDASIFDAFADEDSFYAATCERAFVRYLNGGCSSPIAAHATVYENEDNFRNSLGDNAPELFRDQDSDKPASDTCDNAAQSRKVIFLRGLYYDEETRKYTTGTAAARVADSAALGIALAKKLQAEFR